MTSHTISLPQLKAIGATVINHTGSATDVCTTRSINKHSYKSNCILIPGRYRLPLRINMTVKLDYPEFWLLVGDGHIHFASGHDSEYGKIQDIADPVSRLNSENVNEHFTFNNRIPFGEFVDISVIYNINDMQVLIGNEERFYSSKRPYMKKTNAGNFSELNLVGFELGLAVTKHSTLSIREITVSEFDEDIPITRGSYVPHDPKAPKPEKIKPTYDSVISKLSPQFQNEARKMDTFFKSLRPMKFKRVLDKGGSKITYVASDFGISYLIVASGAESYHRFCWYIVYSGPVETWHRRADYMEEVLTEINKSDTHLAQRIFDRLVDCSGCYSKGLCKTLYQFNGEKKLNCHGNVLLRMNLDDFSDVREFFRYLNALIEQNITNGDPPPEKIILSKSR